MYDVKYGQVRGTEQGFDVVLASGQTILAASSKFVAVPAFGTIGTNGNIPVTLATVGTTRLLGHLEVEGIPNSVNTGSTLGSEVRKCVNDSGAYFRVPILGGTYTPNMKGRRYDLGILNAGGTGTNANVQGCFLTSYVYGQLVVMGGDLDDNQFVDVQVYQGFQPASLPLGGTA